MNVWRVLMPTWCDVYLINISGSYDGWIYGKMKQINFNFADAFAAARRNQIDMLT